MEQPSTRGPITPALAIYAVTLAAAMALQSGPAQRLLGAHSGLAFAALWLYAPILALRVHCEDWESHGLTFSQAPGAARLFGFAVLLLVPYTALAAGWQAQFEQRSFEPAIPAGIGSLALAQLILVALPEEVFFRGYLQTRLDGTGPAWTVWRFRLGRGLVASSVLFAVAHLVLLRQPASLVVFFPGLAFGYLRQQSGSVAYPILYHALCNLYKRALFG